MLLLSSVVLVLFLFILLMCITHFSFFIFLLSSFITTLRGIVSPPVVETERDRE